MDFFKGINKGKSWLQMVTSHKIIILIYLFIYFPIKIK